MPATASLASRPLVGVVLGFLLLSCLSLVSCGGKKNARATANPGAAAKNLPPIRNGALGYGDELNIAVWRHDDLKLSVKVDEAGNITVPLAGQVPAKGRTTAEVQADLTTRLAKYVVNPMVTVTTQVVRSQLAYVLGEVKNQGAVVLDHDVSLWEGLARCGGFTNDARKSAVLVLREENGKGLVFTADMDLQGGAEPGAAFQGFLRGGDIVFVPKSTIASIEEFLKHLDTVLTPLITAQRFIIFMPQVQDAVEQIFQGTPDIQTTNTVGGEDLSNQGGGIIPTPQ